MRYIFFIITLILPTTSISAREWRNTSGDKSFEATYLSSDGKKVTLRKASGVITFPIAKLHPDDQAWLKAQHPDDKSGAGSKQKNGNRTPAPEGAAFDTLEFGDTRKEVTAKLLASQMVESTIAEAMLTRVGLNGSFRIKETIGGLHCHLYFDWGNGNTLKEITLRTKGQPISAYSGSLQSNWTALINLLTILHGDPAQGAPYPKSASLQDGSILSSHLWHSKEGHSILLGTGRAGSDYSVIVRITSEKIATQPIKKAK